MSWTYQQSTGILRDRCGALAGIGYSGFGNCKNLPSAQVFANQGPIPRGFWDILGPPEDTLEHGPYVLRLQPYVDTKTFSRDGFVIQGECVFVPGMASHGSIVMPCVVRREIWESGDYILQVIA
jgi:hypothetical protein